MPIVVFLIDTSASMRQKVSLHGVKRTYLDIAKSAVDAFITARQRCPESVTDRYLLLTFDEPPDNVKSGWREPMDIFVKELNNLQCNGLTTLEKAVSNVFDLLNLFRLQCGIDTYGHGRCPFYMQHTAIIVITDGGVDQHLGSIVKSTKPPLNHALPRDYLTKESYRWDQSMYTIVLRMAALHLDDFNSNRQQDNCKIKQLCEETGGCFYNVVTSEMLTSSIESIVKRVQNACVIIDFEAKSKGFSLPSLKTKILVRKNPSDNNNGNWPLPESYCLSSMTTKLPSRDAHPKLLIKPQAVDMTAFLAKLPNFPVDKYELPKCTLRDDILKQNDDNKYWQVNILLGTEEANEANVGYLKVTSATQQIHFYVLPYNYMALFPLVQHLVKNQHVVLDPFIITKFTEYLSTTPHYYRPYLKKALLKIRVPTFIVNHLLPETTVGILPTHILKQLAYVRSRARERFEVLSSEIDLRRKQLKHHTVKSRETYRLALNNVYTNFFARTPFLRNTFADLNEDINTNEYIMQVPQLVRQPSATSLTKPFKIPRRDLIEDMRYMRKALLQAKCVERRHQGYSVSIAEMSNFYATMKMNEKCALREIQTCNINQNIFGNPYKKSKNKIVVDETEYKPYLKAHQPCAIASPETSDFNNGKSMNAKSLDAVRFSKTVKQSKKFKRDLQKKELKSNAGSCSIDLKVRHLATLNHNRNLRTQIFRCIRRPGRDYTELFEYLNRIKGNQPMKQTFIDMCINESQRFRRTHMIHSIIEWWAHEQSIGQKRRERRTDNEQTAC